MWWIDEVFDQAILEERAKGWVMGVLTVLIPWGLYWLVNHLVIHWR